MESEANFVLSDTWISTSLSWNLRQTLRLQMALFFLYETNLKLSISNITKQRVIHYPPNISIRSLLYIQSEQSHIVSVTNIFVMSNDGNVAKVFESLNCQNYQNSLLPKHPLLFLGWTDRRVMLSPYNNSKAF